MTGAASGPVSQRPRDRDPPARASRSAPAVRDRDAATDRLVMRSYDRRSGRFRRQRDLRVRAASSDVTVDARGELQIALDGASGLELLATSHRARRIGRRRTLVHDRFSSFYGLQVGAGRSGRGLVVWSSGPSGGGVRAVHL
jgi:hypothetical protein